MHTHWVEVNLKSVVHNLEAIRALVGPAVKIMAVVKADAYGHGAVKTSKGVSDAGVDYLAVTTLEEALELRQAGVSTPTLVFAPLLSGQMDAAIEADLDQTVCSSESLRAISEAAGRVGKTARIHVKADTGMGRLGLMPSECPDFLSEAVRAPGIEIAGIYTHFANAGAKDLSSAREQNEVFKRLMKRLDELGLPTGLRHAANSSAILNMPNAHHDMVRPGTILYGQFPTAHTERKIELEEAWRLKTRIVALRSLPAGSKVGYGSEYTTTRTTRAAVIPIGYCDGFTLIPESVARRAASPLRLFARALMRTTATCVSIRGKKAPVIGRVSMQMTTIDVTDIPGVELGDEVIVPARRTTTSSRIPRVYL
jgi:alanine racemase